MIKFENVSKSFQDDFWKKPKRVVNNLSFEVNKGSLCGFLGANGAGKTTSIKATLGFIHIDSGQISFDREMGKTPMEIRSRIGYFPESPYFYPHMTGHDFCMYLGQLQSIPKAKILERMNYWGERLAIAFAFEKKIRGYSKGMLQRLGFVSTLIHEPRLVILDEPLSGLDPVGRKEFKDILIDLNNRGVTIFFSSHIVSDVEEICDGLVVIRNGELFYSGKTEDLLNKETTKNLRVKFYAEKIPQDIQNSYTPIKNRDNFHIGTIPLEDKDKLLQSLLRENGSIHELILEKQSLEEIIYNTKKTGEVNL